MPINVSQTSATVVRIVPTNTWPKKENGFNGLAVA
jgi:hypothetical protein